MTKTTITNNVSFSDMNLGYYLTALGFELVEERIAMIRRHDTEAREAKQLLTNPVDGSDVKILITFQGTDEELLMIQWTDAGERKREVMGRTSKEFQQLIRLLQEIAQVEEYKDIYYI